MDVTGSGWVRTVCKECGKLCSTRVRVDNGIAVDIDSIAESHGRDSGLCWKARAGLERLYHPDRLQFPVKRMGARGEGRWQRIDWQEAMAIVADKLYGYKADYGAEAVAFIKGHYDRRCDWVSRLANAFGTPNIAGIDNTCYIPSASGRLMTYGFDGRPDFGSGPDCVLSWGSSASPPIKAGAKLIVVNALCTKAARRADLWLQPRPATDLALALGILHVIIKEQRFDKDFVDRWTVGFDELSTHIQAYTPESVAEITWVPKDIIITAARMFSEPVHACLYQGNASEDTVNSTQFSRTLAIIQAICGTLDIPGGTVEPVTTPYDNEGTASDVLCSLLSHTRLNKKLGRKANHFPTDPLWSAIANKPAELQPQYLIDALLEGTPYPVKGAFVLGSNPLLTWCNANRVHKALSRIDFMAVADMVMTPTAALADVVLPVASYLETDGVVVKRMGKGDTCIQAQRKVVQIGECRSDLEIINDLAERWGLSDFFWKDSQAYLDDYLERVGIDFAELCDRDMLVSSGTRYRKYLEKGFATPTGMVELKSTLCEKWGYESLPVYHEPKETPMSAPDMLDDYPLILTSFHEENYVHSQNRQLSTLRSRTPGPVVLIHPDTATKLGIAQGDDVYIENQRGRIKQRAALSDRVDPRVISVAYGWWFPEKSAAGQFGWDEANINILTDDSPPYSPEIGSPSMRGFLCRVTKAE